MKEIIEPYLNLSEDKYEYNSYKNGSCRFNLPDEENIDGKKITYSIDIYINGTFPPFIEVELFRWFNGKYKKDESVIKIFKFNSLKYLYKFFFMIRKKRKISEMEKLLKTLPKSITRSYNLKELEKE